MLNWFCASGKIWKTGVFYPKILNVWAILETSMLETIPKILTDKLFYGKFTGDNTDQNEGRYSILGT